MNKGCIIFLTGLPCAGKSTIGRTLYSHLYFEDVDPIFIDADEFRKEYCKDLGFSPEDRKENIRRVTKKAVELERQGRFVVCAFVSPYRKMRKEIRKQAETFIEVFVDADLEICMDRDVKGMYKKAIQGEIKEFTGYNAPYQKPWKPEVHCKTDCETVEESTYKIMHYMMKKEII